MKGSDKIEMTINIGGELIKLDVQFDEQNNVRDAENEVKRYLERLKTSMPEASEKKLMAMATYQFAYWYQQLIKIQEEAIESVSLKCHQIDEVKAQA